MSDAIAILLKRKLAELIGLNFKYDVVLIAFKPACSSLFLFCTYVSHVSRNVHTTKLLADSFKKSLFVCNKMAQINVGIFLTFVTFCHTMTVFVKVVFVHFTEIPSFC